MTYAAAWFIGSVVAGLAWLALASARVRRAAGDSFTLRYVHPDDVAEHARAGWRIVGIDPRYRTRIMRRDGVVAAPASTRKIAEGVG